MLKITLACGLAVAVLLPDYTRAADLDYTPCPSEVQQMLPPPPMAYRPPGRPPSVVYYARITAGAFPVSSGGYIQMETASAGHGRTEEEDRA
jgi:hypothetical protein